MLAPVIPSLDGIYCIYKLEKSIFKKKAKNFHFWKFLQKRPWQDFMSDRLSSINPQWETAKKPTLLWLLTWTQVGRRVITESFRLYFRSKWRKGSEQFKSCAQQCIGFIGLIFLATNDSSINVKSRSRITIISDYRNYSSRIVKFLRSYFNKVTYRLQNVSHDAWWLQEHTI